MSAQSQPLLQFSSEQKK